MATMTLNVDQFLDDLAADNERYYGSTPLELKTYWPHRLVGEAAIEAIKTRWFNEYIGTIVLAPVLLYQRVISPALPRRCKYEPTCSAYAVDAVRQFGILRGLVLAGWRLLRCNPWSHGGYDPVSAQRVFRARRSARRSRLA